VPPTVLDEGQPPIAERLYTDAGELGGLLRRKHLRVCLAGRSGIAVVRRRLWGNVALKDSLKLVAGLAIGGSGLVALVFFLGNRRECATPWPGRLGVTGSYLLRILNVVMNPP